MIKHDDINSPVRFAMIALSIDDNASLAVSGTLEAVFTASTQVVHAASMLSTLIWREFSGLSHLHETRMDGSSDLARPPEDVSKRLN
jgi:hypothetical protein